MKKIKQIIDIIVMVIFAPLTFLLRSNAIPNPNKRVNSFVVAGISILITALIIFMIYFAREIFKW